MDGHQFHLFLKLPSGVQSAEFMVQTFVPSHHETGAQESPHMPLFLNEYSS